MAKVTSVAFLVPVLVLPLCFINIVCTASSPTSMCAARGVPVGSTSIYGWQCINLLTDDASKLQQQAAIL